MMTLIHPICALSRARCNVMMRVWLSGVRLSRAPYEVMMMATSLRVRLSRALCDVMMRATSLQVWVAIARVRIILKRMRGWWLVMCNGGGGVLTEQGRGERYSRIGIWLSLQGSRLSFCNGGFGLRLHRKSRKDDRSR